MLYAIVSKSGLWIEVYDTLAKATEYLEQAIRKGSPVGYLSIMEVYEEEDEKVYIVYSTARDRKTDKVYGVIHSVVRDFDRAQALCDWIVETLHLDCAISQAHSESAFKRHPSFKKVKWVSA